MLPYLNVLSISEHLGGKCMSRIPRASYEKCIKWAVTCCNLNLKTLYKGYLCSGQQRLQHFVVFNRDIKGLQEFRHKRIHHLLGCFILLMDDLEQATLFHRS